MKTSVLLFAAGLGTRMGALTQHRPKPLITVAGRALIDHALDFTHIASVTRRVVNLHHKPAMLRAHLSNTDILFSDETDALLETGGGLRHALPLMNSNPVATMNTDAVWNGPNPLAQLISEWCDEMEALLLIVPKTQVSGHLGKGDFGIDAAKRLHRRPEHIYTGVQIIRTETLQAIEKPAFSMNMVWDQMAERGGLYGTVYSGQWCDVGQPSSLALAEAMLDV